MPDENKSKEKALSMLGLARRAGKLSMGHDMAEQALLKNKAQLLLFCSDASQRLINEFNKTIEKHRINTRVIITDFTMGEIHFALGYKAAVFTVNDKNFSNRIIQLIIQEENANGD
ncbi:MAG TPA: 50S ribosomal protein L7ae [Ruminococcaceae bacterium]|nr:50S ribosomal protein L7ae [Oscillospiraceae bacterium]